MASKSLLNMTKSQLKDFIRKQTNTINRKIPQFEKKDVRTYFDMIDNFLPSTIIERTKKGRLSANLEQFNSFSKDELKYVASAMWDINNNTMYGSLKKYEKHTERGIKYLHETIIDEFADNKGYGRTTILDMLKDKRFTNDLLEALDNAPDYVPSDNTIEQVINNYLEGDKQLRSKTLSNIEYRLAKEKRYENFRNEILRGE